MGASDYAAPVWLSPDPRQVTLTHISAAGNYLIKDSPGYTTTLNVNTSSTGSMTLYDGLDATGSVMAVIDLSKNTTTPAFAPWPFRVGLFVVTTGNADITLISH